MSKTLHRPETQLLIELLRDMRVSAGLTQAQLSEQLGRGQSFASDVERGQRRLDLVQLRDWCEVIGSTLPKLVRDFEQRIEAAKKPTQGARGTRRR